MAKLKQCKACGAEISKSAKTCPKCGQKNGGGCLKILLAGIGIIVILGALGSLFGDKTDKEKDVSTNAPAPIVEEKKAKYEVLEEKIEEDSFTRYITGKVKNNSGKDVSYVQIEINLYDKDGNQIGSTLDNVNNLEKDGVWSFKAIMLEDNAASYKIKDITGF